MMMRRKIIVLKIIKIMMMMVLKILIMFKKYNNYNGIIIINVYSENFIQYLWTFLISFPQSFACFILVQSQPHYRVC